MVLLLMPATISEAGRRINEGSAPFLADTIRFSVVKADRISTERSVCAVLKRVANDEEGEDEEAALLPLTPETVSSAPTDERKQAQLLQLLLRPAGWLWSAGIPCCLTSAFLLSINATLVKSLRELSIFEVALVRSVFGIVFTLSLVRHRAVPVCQMTVLQSIPTRSYQAILHVWVYSTTMSPWFFPPRGPTIFIIYPHSLSLRRAVDTR
jgi:hypothetical protein